MARILEAIWYGKHPLGILLAPLGWIYAAIAVLRRAAYINGLFRVHRIQVPVVVVGNVSVGGTGKTPLVIWLCEFLRSQRLRPAIITGGYRGKARSWPQQVRPDSDPIMVGDESVVIARRCDCPVAAGPDRVACAEALLAHYPDCDVLISDDGMQHYALGRDVEIVVVDGIRRFGNGRCLPAGPLREPRSRVYKADSIVTNGVASRGEFPMKYVPRALRLLRDPSQRMPIESLAKARVHAVAGVGNPERFFVMLRAYGLQVIPHSFPDHHAYRSDDVLFDDELPVVMTEKDAVKCERFAGPDHWFLPIDAELPQAFDHRLMTLLRGSHARQTAAGDPGLSRHEGPADL